MTFYLHFAYYNSTNLGQGQNCKVEGGGNDLLYDLSLTNTCQIENQRTDCALV